MGASTRVSVHGPSVSCSSWCSKLGCADMFSFDDSLFVPPVCMLGCGASWRTRGDKRMMMAKSGSESHAQKWL